MYKKKYLKYKNKYIFLKNLYGGMPGMPGMTDMPFPHKRHLFDTDGQDRISDRQDDPLTNIALFGKLGAGANFDVADGVKLATEYNYQSFGKGKFKKDDFKPSFDGHVLLAKLQFNI